MAQLNAARAAWLADTHELRLEISAPLSVIGRITAQASVSSRTTLAGAPRISELSGNTLPSVTTAPAPTRQLRPITAPFKTTA
jgi:hypothetical protein